MRIPDARFVCFFGFAIFLAPAQTFTITTVAGGGSSIIDGGPATGRHLAEPTGVALDVLGNLFIADAGADVVYKVDTTGIITTFAGMSQKPGYSGDGKAATEAQLNQPKSVAVDAAGNVYIADYGNSVVRKVAPDGSISTFAGNGQVESSPGGTGDHGPPTSAELSGPTSVALDSSGDLYIADTNVRRVREVSGGTITTVAGTGLACCSGEGGPAVMASISAPEQISFDSSGDLLIAESNAWVHKVSGGILSRLAGTGIAGYSGNGGLATSAQLGAGVDGVIAFAGNIYIADTYNNLIRVVDPNGVIETAAGTTTCGYTGDGGLSLTAELCQPMGMAMYGDSIYFADYQNGVVRRMTLNGTPSIMTGGILNAASYAVLNGAGTPVAPGSLVAIFTAPLGVPAAAFSGTSLPDSLGGVTVTFNSVPAPIVQVWPGNALSPIPYVSAQVPFEVLAPGQTSATVAVELTVNNVPAPILYEQIVPSSPGIFTIPPNGKGNAILVFINPMTNQPAIAAPLDAGLSYPTAPIPRGTLGFFYVTGLGAMTPGVPDGSGACPASDSYCYANAMPTVTVGGASADVKFAGQAPGFPGVFQVNIVIPQNAPTGTVPLVITSADGSVSSNLALITVQ